MGFMSVVKNLSKFLSIEMLPVFSLPKADRSQIWKTHLKLTKMGQKFK